MKTFIIQHEDSTSAGSTVQWLEQRNISYEIVDASKGIFPSLDSFKDLIICGGSMNVDQEKRFPWLSLEKKFIKDSILSKKHNVLGICLGAQLIAECLGAKVQSMKQWEIGWHPILLQNIGTSQYFFHWHQYHCALPENAKLLASSEICPVQGFQWGSHVTALQFHPEADEKWIEPALHRYRPPANGKIQTKSEIIDSNSKYLESAQRWYFSLLDSKFSPKIS